MKNILVTGGCGFIGSNFINNFFKNNNNFNIINLDALYYCGSIENILPKIRNNPNYTFIKGDVCDTDLLLEHLKDCDHLVAAAAKIGGISYFHEYAYDLMAENERIMASTFDAAIKAHKDHKLKKITGIKDISMANATEVKNQTGFSIGGVSPIGLKNKLDIMIDNKLNRFVNIFAAAGHSKTIFKINFKNLVNITSGQVAEISE